MMKRHLSQKLFTAVLSAFLLAGCDGMMLNPVLDNMLTESRFQAQERSTRMSQAEAAQVLREYGITNPNADFVPGIPQLGRAAFEGNTRLLRALIAGGAYLNAVCPAADNRTALFMAVTANHPECVRILLNAGANYHMTISADDGTPITARDYAIILHHPECVEAINEAYERAATRSLY